MALNEWFRGYKLSRTPKNITKSRKLITYFENLQKILRLAGGQIQWLPATRKMDPKFHQKNQRDLSNAWEQPSVDSLVKIRTECQYETPYFEKIWQNFNSDFDEIFRKRFFHQYNFKSNAQLQQILKFPLL